VSLHAICLENVMIGVLLADNHAVVRDCILRILIKDFRIRVLADAFGLLEASNKIQRFRPEVLVLDIDMLSRLDSRESDLKRQLTSSGTKVLGISLANDDEARLLAENIGAAELLDKISLAKELIPAIIRLAGAEQCGPTSTHAIGLEHG
jgi:DNA-binding NarL/FixJ family response regulator